MAETAKQAAVWFTDRTLHARLKARCATEGRSMSKVIERLVAEWLATPVDGVTSASREPRAPRASSKALASVEAQLQARLEERAARSVSTAASLCQRCGHAQAVHQKSGCLGMCTCSVGRFKA